MYLKNCVLIWYPVDIFRTIFLVLKGKKSRTSVISSLEEYLKRSYTNGTLYNEVCKSNMITVPVFYTKRDGTYIYNGWKIVIYFIYFILIVLIVVKE